MLETPAPIDPGLDVIHRAAGGRLLAGKAVGDSRCSQNRASGGSGIGEDVVAFGSQRAIKQLHDLKHSYRVSGAGERVAALYAALGTKHAAAAQGGDELLEELCRDLSATGDFADRNRLVGASGQLGQRGDGVGRLGRNRNHPSTLPD